MSIAIGNAGETIRQSFTNKGYPYSEDQLNLVEESSESSPTVYAVDNPKKYSLVLDPSWIEETFEKFEYATTNLYVSPKNDKTENFDNNNYLDYNYNKMLDEFDVRISQKLPSKIDNFKVIVNIRAPKTLKDPYLQIYPPDDNVYRRIEAYYDFTPMEVLRLKLIDSRLFDIKPVKTGFMGNGHVTASSEVSAIEYLDSVIKEHEFPSGRISQNSSISEISFDVKIVAKPPQGKYDFFRIVVPVGVKNSTEFGRS